jgi:hypothetical protein
VPLVERCLACEAVVNRAYDYLSPLAVLCSIA